ncbi:MAG: hypothetical protein HYY06_10750 [Deltaproteobacteria bacterium]|nr:hypothetical protein [Deltaproteobacteria bacterium]
MLDRRQDVVDMGRIVKGSWSADDAREAHRLAELYRSGAGDELDRLVDDLVNDRPITILSKRHETRGCV